MQGPGQFVGAVAVPASLGLPETKAAALATLIAHSWQIHEQRDDRVIGYLNHRGHEALVTLICRDTTVEIYCVGYRVNKRSGERLAPEMPNGWIRNIQTTLNRNLTLAKPAAGRTAPTAPPAPPVPASAQPETPAPHDALAGTPNADRLAAPAIQISGDGPTPEAPIRLRVVSGEYPLTHDATLMAGAETDVEESWMTFPAGLRIEVGEHGVTLKTQQLPEHSRWVVDAKGNLVRDSSKPAVTQPPVSATAASPSQPDPTAASSTAAATPPDSKKIVRFRSVDASYPDEVTFKSPGGGSISQHKAKPPAGMKWIVVKVSAENPASWSGIACAGGALVHDAAGQTYPSRDCVYEYDGAVAFIGADYILGSADPLYFLFSVPADRNIVKFSVGATQAALEGSPAAAPTAAAPAGDPAAAKKLQLVFIDKNKVAAAGRSGFVRYYDEKTRKNVLRPFVTDAAGSVELPIPGNADGSSYVFQIVTTEKQLRKANAFRFAPRIGDKIGGGSHMLVTIDEGLSAEFTQTATQLMRYPEEGGGVGGGGDIATGTLGWPLLGR